MFKFLFLGFVELPVGVFYVFFSSAIWLWFNFWVFCIWGAPMVFFGVDVDVWFKKYFGGYLSSWTTFIFYDSFNSDFWFWLNFGVIFAKLSSIQLSWNGLYYQVLTTHPPTHTTIHPPGENKQIYCNEYLLYYTQLIINRRTIHHLCLVKYSRSNWSFRL